MSAVSSRRLSLASLLFVSLLLLWTSEAEGKLKFQPLDIPEGVMELVDLDGDSLKDIVVYTFRAVLVFWHHEGEGFRSTPDFEIRKAWANEFTEDFTLADLNADGLTDIFVVKDGGANIHYQQAGKKFSSSPDVVLDLVSSEWMIDLGDLLPNKGIEVVTIGPLGVSAWTPGQDGKTLRRSILTEQTVFLKNIQSDIFSRQWPCPWNFCMDANGDGLDDFFLPEMKGSRLFLQKNGEFSTSYLLKTPVVVEFSTGSRSSRTMHPLTENRTPSLWTGLQAPSISCRDFNNDGRTDVVLDEVFGYPQLEDGSFPEKSERVDREIITDVREPVYDATFDEYCDVNGDGITDRVYQYRPWSTGAMKSVVHVYFGDRHANLYAIDPDQLLPDTKKVGSNFLFEAPLVDLNGDGALDILMFDTNYKITEVADWIEIHRGQIDGSVHVTYFDKKSGKYPAKSSYVRKVSINYAIRTYEIFEGRIFDYVRTMLSVNYDFNGDGRKDLLVRAESRDNEDTLLVYENTGDEDALFTQRPTVVLKTPTFHSFRIMDVNSDGISDFVLYNSGGQRVGILMSYYSKGL
ncbi:MAG: hypothetical protein Kow00107_03740 [Planctomycetota bacterium]